MKKFVSMITLLVMLFSCFSISAAAALPPTVEPIWDHTGLVTGTIAFIGPDKTEGMADMQVLGKNGVTKIEISIVVYKIVGSELVYVTGDSKTINHRNGYLAVEFTGEHGYEYQADVHIVVYKGTVGEVIDDTMKEICK